MDSRPDHTVVGRFAPSPTGALHSGSLVAAVGSYLMAKRSGGRWLLRLDDLDAPRQKPGMADDVMRTLESFGLEWDGNITRQSNHLEDYQKFFETLRQTGVVYPCGCSRKEIACSASAPHLDDDCIPYPGTCREGLKENSTVRSWRIRVPDDEICFCDQRKGTIRQSLATVSGDFVLKRAGGEFAYQLAAVVDDYLSAVNQVVRGEDLLASTPRQIYLQRLLGFQQPDYCHLPLVVGVNGSKLSKRDNLVSQQLGSVAGREQSILVATLNFLGLKPPPKLAGFSCAAILQWGVSHFTPQQIPDQNGALEI